MIGKTISHYKITAELGRGGMGVVYEAEHTRLKQPVALKFLPKELTGDQSAKTRFTHEAQAGWRLGYERRCA
jgi:serine/threonine protein kinase